MSGATFSGAILSDVSLSGADLTGAIFTDANLSGANFSVASLSGANFTGANLRLADGHERACYDVGNSTEGTRSGSCSRRKV